MVFILTKELFLFNSKNLKIKNNICRRAYLSVWLAVYWVNTIFLLYMLASFVSFVDTMIFLLLLSVARVIMDLLFMELSIYDWEADLTVALVFL